VCGQFSKPQTPKVKIKQTDYKNFVPSKKLLN